MPLLAVAGVLGVGTLIAPAFAGNPHATPFSFDLPVEFCGFPVTVNGASAAPEEPRAVRPDGTQVFTGWSSATFTSADASITYRAPGPGLDSPDGTGTGLGLSGRGAFILAGRLVVNADGSLDESQSHYIVLHDICAELRAAAS